MFFKFYDWCSENVLTYDDIVQLLMKAQNIANIFYALLGMGILVVGINHISNP